MTNRILPETYIDEYAPAAPTTRLDGPGRALDAYLPQRPLPFVLLLLIALSAPAWMSHAWYSAGYAAGYAVGVLQPWIDARGWIALLFVALGLPVLIIAAQSRKPYTYSERY